MTRSINIALALGVALLALGIGACASPSGPSATPSGIQTPGAELGQPSARAVASGLTESSAISPGVTDTELVNTGWTCRTLPTLTVVCAPPGLGFLPRPPTPDNPGAPSYTVWAFVDHEYHHRVKFIRPDLYQGQPCLGDEPWIVFPRNGYYECLDPAE